MNLQGYKPTCSMQIGCSNRMQSVNLVVLKLNPLYCLQRYCT